MNHAFLNNKEITVFESDEEIVEFAEMFVQNKTEFKYNDDEDRFEIELTGQSLIIVEASDINEDGKITIFE
jgi:hypothetical protein